MQGSALRKKLIRKKTGPPQGPVNFSLKLVPGGDSPPEKLPVKDPRGFRPDVEPDEVEEPDAAAGIINVHFHGIAVPFPEFYQQRSCRLTGGGLREGSHFLLPVQEVASAGRSHGFFHVEPEFSHGHGIPSFRDFPRRAPRTPPTGTVGSFCPARLWPRGDRRRCTAGRRRSGPGTRDTPPCGCFSPGRAWRTFRT